MTRHASIQVAQAEIAHPTWEMTKQYLGCHEVRAGIDGNPEVARCDDVISPGSCLIYFALKGQPYWLMIEVGPTKAGTLEVTWVSMEPRLSVFLRIASLTMTPDRISDHVGLVPAIQVELGKPASVHRPQPVKENIWLFELDADLPGQLDEKVAALLARLAPAATRIASLRPECHADFSIILSAWRGNYPLLALDFPPRILADIDAMGAVLAVTVFAVGPELPDEDQE